MKSISSLRRSYTMRVLILSAFLACATAAPTYVQVLPVLPPLTLLRSPLAIAPVALPTVSPGDIQAATIDAQVKAEDQARMFADQARELAEIAAENQNEGVMEANDMAKEKSDLAFWNAEEEKQRALDAERVAAAQADAAVARSSYIPYAEPSVPQTPEQSMPEAAAKSAEMPATTEAAQAPVEAQPAVKMAEPEMPVEAEKPSEAEKPADSVQVESADLKASAPEPTKMETKSPIILPAPYISSIPGLYFPGHIVAPNILHPQW